MQSDDKWMLKTCKIHTYHAFSPKTQSSTYHLVIFDSKTLTIIVLTLIFKVYLLLNTKPKTLNPSWKWITRVPICNMYANFEINIIIDKNNNK